MKRIAARALIGLLTGLIVGLLTIGSPIASSASTSASAAPAQASGGGCTWYVYRTKKNTAYWEFSSGWAINRGFWQYPDKGSLMKTNRPFRGKNRTQIKYEHIWGSWKKLGPGPGNRYPYVNRGAVNYKYCY